MEAKSSPSYVIKHKFKKKSNWIKIERALSPTFLSLWPLETGTHSLPLSSSRLITFSCLRPASIDIFNSYPAHKIILFFFFSRWRGQSRPFGVAPSRCLSFSHRFHKRKKKKLFFFFNIYWSMSANTVDAFLDYNYQFLLLDLLNQSQWDPDESNTRASGRSYVGCLRRSSHMILNFGDSLGAGAKAVNIQQ